MLFIPTASTGWKKNPVELYLSSLGSRRSSITMQNCIKNIARVLGHENYELIDYAMRSGAPLEVIENLQEMEDEGEIYESIEDIWPDYPSKEDFFFNEEEY